MTTRLLALALVWLLPVSAAAQQPHADVEAVIARWADAFATLDGSKSAALYASDAHLWGTIAAEKAVGQEAIRAYFDSGRQRSRSRRVVIGDHETRVYGTTAVSSGRYDFHNVQLDGTATIRRARFSLTFVHRDGRWLIVDHHSSDVPPTP
jgi:uncharacterized protein (TIGR02246 family)